MSAKITLATQKSTGLVVHIDEVDVNFRDDFRCRECAVDLTVVKSKPRKKEWHFRHPPEPVCAGGRDTALHDYAVQLLLENTQIKLTESLNIEYSEPRTEVTILGFRSDVTGKFQNEEVHFEVFVTHDLGDEKILMYNDNKVKCVRIDLSESSLLSASPDTIREAVLNSCDNKRLIYWDGKEKSKNEFGLMELLLVVAAAIGLKFLFSSKRKPRNRRKT